MPTLSLFLVIIYSLPMAVLCLVVYASLRWQQTEKQGWLQAISRLSLLGWPIPLLLCAFSLRDQAPLLGVGETLIGVLVAWFLTLCGGAALVRPLPSKHLSWQDGIVFCAFYLGVVHFISQVFIPDVLLTPLVNAWSSWAHQAKDPEPIQVYSAIFLMWIFPLGIPAIELVIPYSWQLVRDVRERYTQKEERGLLRTKEPS